MSEKMDKSVTIVTLPQMVDLALNTPEIGVVNFTLLHALLHVIVKQLNLHNCNVEFRGSESERLQNYIANANAGPVITLSEYTIGADGKEKPRRISDEKQTLDDLKSEESASIKSKEIAIVQEDDTSRSSKSSKSSKRRTILGSLQKIVVVETLSKERFADTPQFAVGITREELAKLQQDILNLQARVKELIELPSNTGLFTAIRSSKDGSNSPILDMFQILALVKRMDATEVSVNKLASIVEDLAQEQANILAGTQQEQEPSEAESTLAVNELISRTRELRKSIMSTISGAMWMQELIAQINDLEDRVEKLEKNGVKRKSITLSQSSAETAQQQSSSKMLQGKSVSKASTAAEEGTSAIPRVSITPKVSIISETESDETDESYRAFDFNVDDLSHIDPREAILILQSELLDLKEAFKNDIVGVEVPKVSKDGEQNLISVDKFGQLDIQVKDTKEQMATINTWNNERFSSIELQINQLNEEIAAAWEQITSLGLSAKELESIDELRNKLDKLQKEINALDETAQKLREESEGRENALNIVTDQIQLLKTIKADKEDLEDALADKADACQLYRKLSSNKFDMAYNEVLKAVDHNLNQLNKQEEYWIGALTDLQKNIACKVDKTELQPLKDFINSKLKIIQEKIGKIVDMKKEREAAGTKSKYLKDVNCITCDADVVMKKEADITAYPKPYAMPSSKGAGLYLAYELDQLRKQQKSLANHNKNLGLLENALQFQKIKTGPTDHLCTRYCGGSHTVTTAQQRVMRAGHFLEQWGPEIIPVNEVLIKGTDGRFYKGDYEKTQRKLMETKQLLQNQSATITERGRNDRVLKRDEEREQLQNVTMKHNDDQPTLHEHGEMKNRTRSDNETINQRSKGDFKTNIDRKGFEDRSKVKTPNEKLNSAQEKWN